MLAHVYQEKTISKIDTGKCQIFNLILWKGSGVFLFIKRVKLSIEQDLNESREAKLRMAANNRFPKEKIAKVSRLEEKIDELEERRKKTIHNVNLKFT